ncbi:MAG: DinB family protein [Gemmataceae bacterium]
MREFIQKLVRHMAWADRKTLEALRTAPASHAEALPLMAHVLAAEHVWVSRILQCELRHTVWPKLTFDECDTLAAENAAGYQSLLEGVSEEQLAAGFRYRTVQGQEFVTPMIDILMQVVTHGPYHRGQIAKIIARAGGVTTNTDYILFVREADPSPLR